MLFFMLVYVGLLMIGFAVSGSSPTVGEPSPFSMYMRMGAFMGVIGIFWLAMLVPSIAVQVRRLHDTNRSGWWLAVFWILYLLYIITAFASVFSAAANSGSPPSLAGAAAMGIFGLLFFVYSIVLLVFWCLPGTKGANRFGEDPYGPDVEQVFA
jgi:uncharacterized membrane protein YhaH (DUF805 family)